MAELPDSWTTAPVSSLCTKLRGVSFSKGDACRSPTKGLVPIIRANNLANDGIVFEDLIYVPASCVGEGQRLRKNDVIVAMSSGSKAVVGKTAQLLHPWEGSFGAFCGVLRPTQHIDNRYFGMFFRTRAYRNAISELAAGTNINNLKNEHFEAISVPLAPLQEQRRIVAKLEDLLGKVDACQKRLERIPLILKRFRQSVLAAACSGRLTADWRKGRKDPLPQEVVEQLKARRTRDSKTETESRRILEAYDYREEQEDDSLPPSWACVALRKLCRSFDYGSAQKSQPSGKVPVLRMGNIQNGKLDWSDLVYSSDKDEISKYALKPKTVLFNRTNSPELVGKTAIYNGERPAIFAGYLIRINAEDVLDPDYLNLCLNTPYARRFCSKVKTDGVSQSNINAQSLGKFEVPFCSIQEQREIVRRVEALFKLADQIESRYNAAKASVDRLTQSILAKAFLGELVPQDPKDEPAGRLLERLRQ